MDAKNLEYVKLVFYEDKNNYDNSWGEVYYRLIYSDNQVHRTYKQKINKKEYILCLKAFRLQEGTNSLPYEKYQVYDAKTKKPLNMPYYLKNKTPLEEISNKVKNSVEKTSDIINNGKEKLKSFVRQKDNVDKSLLYSIKGGISDIRGNNKNVIPYNKQKNKRKLFVRLTSLASATILLSAIGNYELKRNKIYFSDMIYVTKISNNSNYLDNELRNNYVKFEKIINDITSNNYKDISNDDLDFINNYIYKLGIASNDSNGNGFFYEFDYINYLDKNSVDYKFFAKYSLNYGAFLMNTAYKSERVYRYCAEGCNLLFYTVSALSMNKSNLMPSKEDIYSFNQMSPLSKLVFLNQLKGIVVATNFSYKQEDEPYWWIGLRMNTESLIEKINQMISNSKMDLEYDVNQMKKDSSKTI